MSGIRNVRIKPVLAYLLSSKLGFLFRVEVRPILRHLMVFRIVSVMLCHSATWAPASISHLYCKTINHARSRGASKFMPYRHINSFV